MKSINRGDWIAAVKAGELATENIPKKNCRIREKARKTAMLEHLFCIAKSRPEIEETVNAKECTVIYFNEVNLGNARYRDYYTNVTAYPVKIEKETNCILFCEFTGSDKLGTFAKGEKRKFLKENVIGIIKS